MDAVIENTSRSGAGSIIGILLIVLLLVIGAFYVWGQRLSEDRAQVQQAPIIGS